MALTVGIIGLPQSGKTTVFNALTKAGAQISGYPTSTVQANRAVVEVPDERLQRLAEIFTRARSCQPPSNSSMWRVSARLQRMQSQRG